MRQKTGFTLVEMLMALTLMAVIMGSVMFALNHTQKFWCDTIGRSQRLALMQDLLATITDEIKFAGPGTISFDYHDQKVRRRKGNSTAYLTIEGQIDSLSVSTLSPKLFKIIIAAKGLKLEALALCRN